MRRVLALLSLSQLLAPAALAQSFVESGGQIFTPGFAILDSPQPFTPLGGDTLEVALDISADGQLNLPPYAANSPSLINNITIFLSSYTTGRNFTITNGTATDNNATLGNILLSEPGSTVKHVKWIWPQCLIGNGEPTSSDSDRGDYNISIRQNFRLNGDNHYTIFDVPIQVTNDIEFVGINAQCDLINNPLLTPEEINASAANSVGIFLAPGDATTIQQTGSSSGNGLGSGAPAIGRAWMSASLWMPIMTAIVILGP
ncbi:hypothetical protein GGR56DRAFT_205927 [Xylariaceae sp. FL0804]|nr:hypothetical protein GGR56DRAFT_205927 [Xylariaceae sp. FL0804]